MTSSKTHNQNELVLGEISDETEAFSHIPQHGFSLFLANRIKTLHFVRHAEGEHNEANRKAGDDSPVTFSTPGAWNYMDARLTAHGVEQCVTARTTLLSNVNPELVIVSPFTRTLQTAHIMFCGKGVPFMVHDLCRERGGLFTCDKRRSKAEILKDVGPLFQKTNDRLDDSFGYPMEEDQYWTEERETSDSVVKRAIAFMQWVATRPENEIAVVTHSSWLKHLFRSFGHQVDDQDKMNMHRLAGNAEVRSICLALHKGFYPPGEWRDDNFVPHDPSFQRGRWAPSNDVIGQLHHNLLAKEDTRDD